MAHHIGPVDDEAPARRRHHAVARGPDAGDPSTSSAGTHPVEEHAAVAVEIVEQRVEEARPLYQPLLQTRPIHAHG